MKQVILLALIAFCIRGALAGNAPFRSRKSPAETIFNYAVVYPTVVEPEHVAADLNVTFEVESETIEINLILNRGLLAPHFKTAYHHEGEEIQDSHKNCFYHGTVTNHPQWKAAFSTCHGLRGWFGDIGDENNRYHLEPIEDTCNFNSPHALYLETEHTKSKPGTCGTNGGHKISTPSSDLDTSSRRLKRQSGTGPYIVEWLVVNDFFQYDQYDRNISRVTLRAIEIANQVDLLFQPINVRIALVFSLTWTVQQEIQAVTDSSALLNAFRTYHSNEIDRNIEHDSAMMITGVDIDGNTVGVAFVGTMCSFEQSVGVTQDYSSSVFSVGSTATHELGHIFDMEHDDAAACNCPDSNGCIMNAVSGFPPPTSFSQCSRDEFNTGINLFNLGRCLDNNPTTLVGDPTCGNGIMEPGEVCDCGSLQECNDPCCNATSCTLAEGASCASGACCDNCQFIAYGTTCRLAENECDLLEYCTGESSDCPQDVSVQDGQTCDGGQSYCYQGVCASISAQCLLFYGDSSSPSVEGCYTQQNIEAERYGNCGASGGAFVACTAENALCGSLHCMNGQIIFNNIDTSEGIIAYTRFVRVDGQFHQCKSFGIPATSDAINPGFVMEGARCGNNSLCISQECVELSTLGITACPSDSNGQTCSNNGQCNNLNQCSCDAGFTGSDCNTAVTTSTSSRSNAARNAGIAVGVVLLVVLILAVIIILIIAGFIMSRKKKSSVSLSQGRYSRGSIGKRQPHSGSTDDLLSVAERNQNVSHLDNNAYVGYVPPTYVPDSGSPSVTVNNGRRPPPPQPVPDRRPPPPAPAKPDTRPTPLSTRPAPLPPSTKPAPPVPPSTKPVPPSAKPSPPAAKPSPRPPPYTSKPYVPSKPADPAPTRQPGPSPKPVPLPRSSPPKPQPQTAPKPQPQTAPKPQPQTAPKPGKVQWPPVENKPPPPTAPKKPVFPPRT